MCAAWKSLPCCELFWRTCRLTFPAILIAWMVAEPLKLKALKHEPYYDETMDSFVEITENVCSSIHSSHWIGALVAINGVVLFGSGFMTYSLRKANLNPADKIRCSRIRFLTLNKMGIFAAAVLIHLILSSSTQQCVQNAVVAIFQNLYTLSSSVILLFPRRNSP